MKRITYLSAAFVIASMFIFTSCKEDKYLDWKYINEQWLEQHKNDEDWHTDPNGLQYRIIYAGIGDDTPSNKSVAMVKYHGTYINGKTFDSSDVYQALLSSKGGLIAGFVEGIKKMKLNAIYEFRIPYELGYGKDGKGAVPPYTTLLFRIELMEFWTQQK